MKIETARLTRLKKANERREYVRDEEGSSEGRHAQREDERERGRAEVCPLADGQLVVGRVTGHGDLCLRLQRALSLFTLLLKETAGAPPTLRLHSIIRGNTNEVNVR